MPSLFEGDTVGRWRKAEKRAEELRELARKAEPPTMEELNQQVWEAMKESDAMLKITKVRPADRIGRILSKIEAYWRKNPDVRLGQLIVNLTSLKHRSLTVPEIFYLEDEDLEELLECLDDSTISVQQKHPTNMDEIKSRLDNLHMLLDAVAHNTAQWKKQEQEKYPNVAHEVASIRADLTQAADSIRTLVGYLGAPNEDGKCLLDTIEDTADAVAELDGVLKTMGADQRQVQDKLDLILQKLGELPQFHSSHEVKGRQPGTPPSYPDLPAGAEYCGANPNRPYEDGLKVRLDPTTGRKYYVGADGEKKYFD